MGEKEAFIRDFNQAFSRNDLDFILDHMSEEIVWHFTGEKTLKGKAAVKEFMKPMAQVQTLEMELLQVITHGRTAAANGKMTIKEPSGAIKNFGFADFYTFTSGGGEKVKEMTSYVVAINQK